MARLDVQPDDAPIPMLGVARMLSEVPRVEEQLGALSRLTNAPREFGQSLLEAVPGHSATLTYLMA